jgi:CheY-like chemotaxis protein
MAEKYKILVIEDEGLVAKDIGNMIRQLEYETPYIVHSGEEALKMLSEVRPDLVLMDIGLRGEIDGVETAERIKAQVEVPIIYLTSYSDEDTLQRAKGTDPYGYIIKPFEAIELKTTVEMALSRYKTEKQLRDKENLFRETLEATMDGILVVNRAGKVMHGNSRFAEMWRIPEEILGTADDETLLQFVLDQLQDPDAFLSKVKKLYNSNAESHDTLKFKDERVFERYSKPLMNDKENVGRVWSFREISNHDNDGSSKK